MEYIGEHLLPGTFGHLFVLISLVSSLVATIAYYKANFTTDIIEKQNWTKFARISFLIETISVFSIFIILFYIISHHLFEYKYAFQHSDKSLKTEYLLSCFWEGQEGSFMLWSFWHCILGWAIIWTNKKWEAGVLMVISFAQFCLATMLTGLYFSTWKMGTSPFILLRNDGFLDNAPIFKDIATGNIRADYLTLLKDGTGLNTLLQNYWMVIHPPVLFLGFASTIVPFAFAVTGLMNKNHDWKIAALPWASFSGAVLGTGIMMGAAWAYESLSFGGYWAWDPVENASLVPWLTLVAGLHTNMVYKKTGHSLRTTYFLYIITFVLVLYSTFLTRSGILGDTSVHAFTGADMTTQLIVFVLVFFIPAITLFLFRYKSIPYIQKEESSSSREFWMFIGALVLFLSAIIIIAKTSIPVYNKIFGTNIAPPEEREFAYNQVQVFIAIIIGILTAVTQYFRFKETPSAQFGKKIVWPTVITLVVSACISIFGGINYDKFGTGFLIAIHAAILAGVYAIVANAMYILVVLKGKLKSAGASVAHVGFGLVLLGILISSSKKTVLSVNTTGISVFQKNKTEDPAENLTLFKNVPTNMGKYMVTYVQDTFNTKENKKFFEIDFKAKDSSEHFKVYPDLIKNNKGMGGFNANPASKHYWYKDIFVYISAYQENDGEDTATFRNIELKVGDTTYYSNGMLVLNNVLKNPKGIKPQLNNADTSIFLDMTVMAKDGRIYKSTPGIILRSGQLIPVMDTVVAQSMIIGFNGFGNKDYSLKIGIKESSAITDLITLKVYEFPMINILWIGVLVMVTGFIMSMRQRILKMKAEA